LAFYENVSTRTYIAGAVIPQFSFVQLAANGKVLVPALGGRADATTMTESTAVDQAITGAYDGRVMVKAGGAIARGGPVATNAAGLAVAAALGNVIVGYALEAAVINQIMTVEINRAGTLQP